MGLPARTCAVTAAVLTWAAGSAARAAETQTPRAGLVDTYADQATATPPLYQSAPITHIVPEFNTVTYALDARMLDTEVHPDDGAYYGPGTPPAMTVKGYSVAPYVALSLKRVGLGFNVEGGTRTIDYTNGTSSYGDEQHSALEYRGLGIFGFFKMIDGKTFEATLIAGGKSLNAKHSVGRLQNQGQTDDGSTEETFRYTVNDYEAGINLGMHLLKTFTVIPWGNYAYLDDSGAKSLVNDKYDTTTKGLLDEDRRVFWHSQPVFNYGLDFAVRVASFEVRLGGLFGMLVGGGDDPDVLKDKGYSLSVSWDQKG